MNTSLDETFKSASAAVLILPKSLTAVDIANVDCEARTLTCKDGQEYDLHIQKTAENTKLLYCDGSLQQNILKQAQISCLFRVVCRPKEQIESTDILQQLVNKSRYQVPRQLLKHAYIPFGSKSTSTVPEKPKKRVQRRNSNDSEEGVFKKKQKK